MDTSTARGATGPGQKLSGRRGAGEEEHLDRQSRDHREGFRSFAFEAVGYDLELTRLLGARAGVRRLAKLAERMVELQDFPSVRQAPELLRKLTVVRITTCL